MLCTKTKSTTCRCPCGFIASTGILGCTVNLEFVWVRHPKLANYEYWSVILSSPSNLVQISVYCTVRILSSFWNQCCHMPQRLSHNLVLLDSIHLLSFDPLLCQMRLWYNSCSYKVQASWIDWWHYPHIGVDQRQDSSMDYSDVLLPW